MSEAASVAVTPQDVGGMLALVSRLAQLPSGLPCRCLLAGLCQLLNAATAFAYCCRFDGTD